jgi:hypothetical protein
MYVPVAGLGGLHSCEASRSPYFLDNHLNRGGKVVSLMRGPQFTPIIVSTRNPPDGKGWPAREAYITAIC